MSRNTLVALVAFAAAAAGLTVGSIPTAVASDAPQAFTQCRGLQAQTAATPKGMEKNLQVIPPGWTVVGGGGNGTVTVLVLCR